MELENAFQKAAVDVNSLTERPSNDELLKLYGLYKQATVGDVNQERPGGFDFKGIAKYDAWASLKGTPKSQAMQRYIDLVNSLLAR